MNSLDEQYRGLLAEVLYNGVKKEDRTGTGTLSRFGMQIRHDMSKGFPILTTKKVSWKAMVTELKWFLRGDTNIKYLLDNNCHIWDGDAYKQYERLCTYDGHEPRHSKEELMDLIQNNPSFSHYGNLGPIYGKQWREWRKHKWDKIDMESHIEFVDQIQNLINDLKTNPDSRRLMVSAWNVGELKHMTLPPCHYSFQCYVADGKLSLMWNQRSADLFLGVPFNISSYGLLLHLLCEETGYEPGHLIGSFGDIHLYKNHIEQAKEQISRDGFNLPELELEYHDIYTGDFDASLKNYQSHPAIKAPLSN